MNIVWKVIKFLLLWLADLTILIGVFALIQSVLFACDFSATLSWLGGLIIAGTALYYMNVRHKLRQDMQPKLTISVQELEQKLYNEEAKEKQTKGCPDCQ